MRRFPHLRHQPAQRAAHLADRLLQRADLVAARGAGPARQVAAADAPRQRHQRVERAADRTHEQQRAHRERRHHQQHRPGHQPQQPALFLADRFAQRREPVAFDRHVRLLRLQVGGHGGLHLAVEQRERLRRVAGRLVLRGNVARVDVDLAPRRHLGDRGLFVIAGRQGFDLLLDLADRRRRGVDVRLELPGGLRVGAQQPGDHPRRVGFGEPGPAQRQLELALLRRLRVRRGAVFALGVQQRGARQRGEQQRQRDGGQPQPLRDRKLHVSYPRRIAPPATDEANGTIAAPYGAAGGTRRGLIPGRSALTRRLHCGARSSVAPQNSLRSLRSLRSNSRGGSEDEAR